MLILGYLVYGRLIDRLFGSDPKRPTPAVTMEDGVDYIKLPPWKIFLIQLLNIAGLGPIYGPILGALYGPVALIWIVIGCIFAGAVHDYFSGMLSVRYGGQSVPDVVGHNLGKGFMQFMRGFSVILLILVGVVFFLGPAALLQSMTGIDLKVLIGIIIAYYFLATILPVDKIIGRIYPLFGAVLIFMAVGTIAMLIVKGYEFYPQRTLTNVNPQDLPLWPLMFITIACGAVSGFHATQSPMMARCLPSEKYGRSVFFGSMIAEGVIALIWATLAISFFDTPAALDQVLAEGGPGLVVNRVSTTLLGIRRPAGHHRRGGATDHIGGYGLSQRAADYRRHFQTFPERAAQTPRHRRSPVCRGLSDLTLRLRAHLALFRLGQPDPGHGGPLDGRRLSGAGEETALGGDHSGHLHDGRGDHLHRQLGHRLQPADDGRHQHRHRQRRGGDGGLFLESQADSIANCRNTGGALRGRCEFDLSLLETNHQGGNAYQGRFPTEGKEEIQ
jgi:hypothetical protein